MSNLKFSLWLSVPMSIVCVISGSGFGQTAVPMLISYQGELRSPTTGALVPDGSYDMVFKIYDVQSAGTPLWEETHSAGNGNPVQVEGGIFSVILGSGTGNALDASLFEGADRWLEIEVAGETLSPRQRITSTAFSIVSENSRLLDGRGVSDFIIQAQGLRLETNDTSPNVIGGYMLNGVTDGVIGGTVSGGGEAGLENRVSDSFGTVGGGRNNRAGDDAGAVDDGAGATVAGGAWNIAGGRGATVGGGLGNQAAADYATIAGGGRSNPADPLTGNRVFDHYGSISGGGNNRAGSDDDEPDNATYATIGGGHANIAGAFTATVAGGDSNTASAGGATVGGGGFNRAEAIYATIAGGGPSDLLDPITTNNRVTDDYGSVSGGANNQAGDNGGTSSDANFATVGGGHTNIAGAFSATVAGGAVNTANAPWAAIGGGNWNKVTDENATIAGGNNNQAGDDAGTSQDASLATVGGGWRNTAMALCATVAGGSQNTASSVWATVGGGELNMASGLSATVSGGEANEASGLYSTVGGGYQNIASGNSATVPGGAGNAVAGDYSFAAGTCAQANHRGAFVWGDSQPVNIASTKDDEVTFRCGGGARFVTQTDISGNPTKWAYLNPVTALWEVKTASDRNLKSDVTPVDRLEILERLAAIPIANWSYDGQQQSVRHMGPMAQDFYKAFGLGGDDKSINGLDADGVALAAIQGLHEIVQEKDVEISTLKARVEALETLVEKLVESQGGEE